MKIGGLQPFTLTDFPGRVAAIVFTQGCNFRCPFCHNGALIPRNVEPELLVPEEQVMDLLRARRGQLDGVVISGGEPTLQPDLATLLSRIKAMQYDVALETNGSRPPILAELLRDELLDFVAMDIKAPMDIYDRLTGVRAPVEQIQDSIALIAQSGVAHEFRTTVVERLLSAQDVERTRQLVPAGSVHRLQTFSPQNALDAALRTHTSEQPRERRT